MNRLRLEWSIFIKSLRVLKKNRRLLNLLVPEAFLRLLLYGIAAKQIANLILLLVSGSGKAGIRHGGNRLSRGHTPVYGNSRSPGLPYPFRLPARHLLQRNDPGIRR